MKNSKRRVIGEFEVLQKGIKSSVAIQLKVIESGLQGEEIALKSK